MLAAASLEAAGSPNTCCATMAPQRIFLCDVPFIFEQSDPDDGGDAKGGNLLRLMGTVVKIIDTSSSSPEDAFECYSRASSKNASHYPTRLIHFVIDDGTGSIDILTERRADIKIGDCISNGASSGQITRPTTQEQEPMSHNTIHNHNFHQAKQPLAMTTLESLLSSPPPSISEGHTVDCIGKIRFESTGEFSDAKKIGNNAGKKTPHRLWLAASSVSIMNNPHEIELRQFELSSFKRLKRTYPDSNNGTGRDRNNGSPRDNSPKNRILAGGSLEHKLNPLFHCNQERGGSVVFRMECAFAYIKNSKDDGGITPKELSLLVGAVEPNEVLAVNLAVEQLREDCRIYSNQGKWFPM